MTEGWDPSALVRDYGDALAEAAACRSRAALFDFSFVARAEIRGEGAERLIAGLTRRSLSDLVPGRIRYALRETDQGHLVSDLTIWKHAAAHCEVMSGRPRDIADLVSMAGPDAEVTDLSSNTVIFAVQGPSALNALDGLGDLRAVSALPYFAFCHAELAGHACLVGRLGYSGEPGFEIVAEAGAGLELWRRLANRARPAGFAAIDLLRIEAGFVLFANEFRLPVSAAEIGLGRFAGGDRRARSDDVALVCFRAQTDADPALWRPSARPTRPDSPGILVPTSACTSIVADGVLGLGFVQTTRPSGQGEMRDPTGTFRDVCLVALPYYDCEKIRPRRPWPERAPGGA